MVNRLIGFGAKRAAAGGGGGDTFTFIGSTTNSGTGYSVSFHGSAATGDVAIVGECFDDTTALSGTPGTVPSGWSVFDDTVTTTAGYTGGARDIHVALYRKVLTSGDISTGSVSSAVTAGGDTANGMVCQIWRPSSTPTFSDQEVDSSAAFPWGGGTVSVTASSGTPLVFVVGMAAGGSCNGMGSETPTFDQYSSVAGAVELGATLYTASPVDQSVAETTASGDRATIAVYSNLSFA